MARVEIPVRGLHCGGCERTLSIALKRLDGVRDAHADRIAGKVKVSFDEARLSESELREQIEQVGYEAG